MFSVGDDLYYSPMNELLAARLLQERGPGLAKKAAGSDEGAAPPAPEPIEPDFRGKDLQSRIGQIFWEESDGTLENRGAHLKSVVDWFTGAFRNALPAARKERFSKVGDLATKSTGREIIRDAVLHLKGGGKLDDAFTREASIVCAARITARTGRRTWSGIFIGARTN